MSQYISTVTLLVNDYDKAISFYTTILGFKLIEDIKMSETKRRVIISPKNSIDKISTSIILAKATTPEQNDIVGKQCGGRVMFILNTDNFEEDYNQYKMNGVMFLEEPRIESYGKVVVFKDIYGNLFDLIQNY